MPCLETNLQREKLEKKLGKKPKKKKDRSSYDFTGPQAKFQVEYCDMLLEHLTKGLSYTSFAAEVGVTHKTLENWCERYPEFKEAKEHGYYRSMKQWELIGLKGCRGEIKNFNAATYIFTMKNRFGWSDRTDLKVEGDIIDDEKRSLLKSVDRKKLLELVKAG